MGVFVTSSKPAETTTWQLRLNRIKNGFSRFIEGTSNWMEKHPLYCIWVLVLIYAPLDVIEAHSHLMTNDEIYTWHIAQAPTLHRMLGMAREIDLHPPLHYLLQRWSLKLDLPRWLGSRLPNMIAGLITVIALFRLAAKHYGNTIGMTAAAAFICSPAIRYAWENRPYMILMCALTLLIYAWDEATSTDRTWRSVVCVLLCSVAMVSDHLIGVACLAPFAVGEAFRLYRRRRADWLLWLSLFTPSLLGLGLFYQIHHLRTNSFPVQNMPSFLLAWNTYGELLNDFFFAASICILALAFMPNARETPSTRKQTLRGEEVAMLWTLALLPMMTLIAGAILHIQFWRRYGFCAMIGVAILVPWMIANRTRVPKTLSVFIFFALIASVIEKASTEYTVVGSEVAGMFQTGRVAMHLQDLDPSLPIVDASPMTYMEMSDREPADILSRVFYLTDYNAAMRYSGYTLFDNEDKIRGILELRTHVAKLRDFVVQHPKFYMVAAYPSTDDWLPRKLADSGVDLNYLGKFVSSYDNDDVFLVTVPPGALDRANAGFQPNDPRVLPFPPKN